MHRRHFFLGFLGLVCWTASLARAAEVELVHVWPGWRDAASFDRISDYFRRGGKRKEENTLRTEPDVRAGYYFLVRLKNAQGLNQGRFVLSVIRPDSPEARTFTFPVATRDEKVVFQLGLTGADWPAGETAHPVAWRLQLVGEDGRILAEEKSFLWEKAAR